MAATKKGKWFISTIGGAHGDHGFEPGDRVFVPADKETLWLDLGLIKPIPMPSARFSQAEADALIEEDL